MNNLALRMLNDLCIAYPDLEVPSYNNTQYYHPTPKGEIEHRDINGFGLFLMIAVYSISTLWFQLEDMFQLIVMPQGIEVTIQLKDTPTIVYAIGC